MTKQLSRRDLRRLVEASLHEASPGGKSGQRAGRADDEFEQALESVRELHKLMKDLGDVGAAQLLAKADGLIENARMMHQKPGRR